MADLMKIVREWEAKRQRVMAGGGKSPAEKLAEKNGWSLTTATEKAEDGKLPWPGGQQFVCDKCDLHFDTSAGFAKHTVYGCDAPKATEATAKTLPSCSTCGSYALHREKDGTLTCQTCEGGKVN